MMRGLAGESWGGLHAQGADDGGENVDLDMSKVQHRYISGVEMEGRFYLWVLSADKGISKAEH